jgi:hypothetical protein
VKELDKLDRNKALFNSDLKGEPNFTSVHDPTHHHKSSHKDLVGDTTKGGSSAGR